MRQMPRIFATCRALGRYLQVFSADGPARDGHRRAFAACLGTDVALWWAIRHERVSLATRIGIDAAELAYWSAVSQAGLQGSVASHIAEHLEAGFRWGFRGYAAPLVDTAVSSAARRLSGGPVEPAVPLGLTGAVLAGGAVREAERRRLGRARQECEAEISARRGRAFLAGQNAVAMGASSAVDLLSTVAALLGSADAGSALYRVRAGWKATLAEQTRRHAVYLDQALRVWEQLHNQHPDLSSDVEVAIPEGVGTTLLSGWQAGALGHLLEARNLRGRVDVDLAPGWVARDRRPGRPVELMVNGEPTIVPADPATQLGEFNPAPPTFAFAAFMALSQIRKDACSVPAPWAAVVALADLGAARYLADRPPGQAAEQQISVGLATAVLQGLIYARAARNRHSPAGAALFPGTYGIAPVLLLLSANWHRTGRPARVGAIGVLVLLAAAAYRLADEPKDLVALVNELVWPVAALVGSSGVTAATEREAGLLVEELSVTSQTIEAGAYDEGCRSVIDLVNQAIDDAEVAFQAAYGLEPETAEAITARILDIRALLQSLETR